MAALGSPAGWAIARPLPAGRPPGDAIHVPAARTWGRYGFPRQRSRTPRASARWRPSTGSIPIGLPTSRSHLMPARHASRPFRSATATRTAGGSPMRLRYSTPPGSTVWLWASMRPGTIVLPRASTIARPAGGPGSSSASVGLIHTIRPCATRTLMPVSRRSDRPVAKLAPRYSVRRPLGAATESLGPSATAFELGAAVASGAGEPVPNGPAGSASGSAALADGGGSGVAGASPRATRKAATEADAVSRRKSRRSIRLWRSRIVHNGRLHQTRRADRFGFVCRERSHRNRTHRHDDQVAGRGKHLAPAPSAQPLASP